MACTVTINTADSEFEAEVELDKTASVKDIVADAVSQTDIELSDVTSYVIVGVAGHD